MDATVERRQHNIVRDSLSEFARHHIGASADLSAIDEIVLSYVVSVLGEAAGVDACFDVDDFVEMMSAYIPEFAAVDPKVTYDWIFQLESEMSGAMLSSADAAADAPSSADLGLGRALRALSLASEAPAASGKRTQLLSETSDNGSTDSGGSTTTTGTTIIGVDFYAGECELLHEMFPATALLEIRHCVGIANGDIDRATQMLLDRQDSGQSLHMSASAVNAPKCAVIDENELKNRIISRYSYVDKNELTKEHRPVGPKVEPKKLVRYRDNKIVSLKGERYTDVRTDDSAELKKPKRSACP